MKQFAKIKVSGSILLESGLHIGASSAFAAIGATDSPIIKDAVTNLPIIPASSLKGKIRSLLASSLNREIAQSHNQDNIKIRRLFGDSYSLDSSQGVNIGQLVFRDAVLSNAEELYSKGLRTLTEVKFENTISRTKATANPRQIERAVAGSVFPFEVIYTVKYEDTIEEDFETIIQGLQLLELDYLGGSGTRGYGKVKFRDLTANVVFGEFDEAVRQEINEKLKVI